jgi:hypothetical protein
MALFCRDDPSSKLPRADELSCAGLTGRCALPPNNSPLSSMHCSAASLTIQHSLILVGDVSHVWETSGEKLMGRGRRSSLIAFFSSQQLYFP